MVNSVIKLLAQDTIKDIKAKQGWFTYPSRKDTVQTIETKLANPNISDNEIMKSFIQACDLIQKEQASSCFGCCDESGLYFINRSNEFLREANATKVNTAKPTLPKSSI